ncbi:MAG: hypothetical protein ABJG41_14450 [Cyclobacteriaceae bacterium]
MAALNNLDALAEQLYLEGMAKSEQESEKLLSEARAKRENLLKEAQEEARSIISKAKKEAEKHRASVDSQIHQKAKQAIQDLKKQIEELINAKLLDTSLKSLLTDKAFVKELILATLTQWKEGKDLELVISEQLTTNHKDLEQSVHKLLPGLTIVPDQAMDSGFKIQDKDQGYILSFTDQDFKAFFKPYFSKAINKIVFESDE